MQELWVFKMLYLASESPRRIELLKWTGLEFEVIGHKVDESKVKAETGEDLVAELSMLKASYPAKDVKGLVIGSDLTVEIEGKQFGKPKNKKQAKEMLAVLSGKTHSIFTGVAVVDTETKEGRMSVAKTRVKMKKYDENTIDKYVNIIPVTDRGGGYGIQDELEGFGSLVESFEGGITTIIGLPMHYLENLLKEFKVTNLKDWRKQCKLETGYEC